MNHYKESINRDFLTLGRLYVLPNVGFRSLTLDIAQPNGNAMKHIHNAYYSTKHKSVLDFVGVTFNCSRVMPFIISAANILKADYRLFITGTFRMFKLFTKILIVRFKAFYFLIELVL